jgi:hypothetical protein
MGTFQYPISQNVFQNVKQRAFENAGPIPYTSRWIDGKNGTPHAMTFYKPDQGEDSLK